LRRALVITNSFAGGDAVGVGRRALELLQTAGWDVEVVHTETRGHGVLLAQDAARGGLELVVAAGGDGTVREVAAGLCGSETALAIAPSGTGNSSYRELFEEEDWEQCLARYLGAEATRAVDLNRVQPTGELSLLGFSAGWFAQVVELAVTETATGRARYAAAAQKAAAAPRAFNATVILDGEPFASGELGLVAVGGARRRGGVFPVLPDSRLDDGQLDVIAVQALDPVEFSDLLQLLLEQRHRESPMVRLGRGRMLQIKSGMPLPAEVDGDLWQQDLCECQVDVVPGALRVIAPA